MTYGEMIVLYRFKTSKILGSKIVSRLIRPLTGVVLGLGIFLAGPSDLLMVHASEQLVSSSTWSSPVRTDSAVAVRLLERPNALGQLYSEALAATSDVPFPANGVYLYGQSPQRDQVGVGYAVMEIVDNQAVGAFYMPQSSFDCFYGAVESNSLDLNIVSSYDQATHQYSVPFQEGVAIATTDEVTAPIQLQGFHPIDAVNTNDHRILGVCRASLAEQI